MDFKARLAAWILAVGTDIKQLRTWITGSSSGDLTGLTTTEKGSIVGAINEVKASATGAPPDATETAKGVVELATLAEVATGTDTTRAVTVAGVRQERTALKAEILGGVGSAFDTLSELYAEISENESDLTDLLTLVGQKADSDDVYLKTETYSVTELGSDLDDYDMVAAYTTAKA